MFPAAVRALHAADLTAEGFQGVQDPRVHGQYGGVAVGKSLILAELGGRRRTGIVILRASKQIINGSSGTSRGSRGTCRTGLSRRSLWIKINQINLVCSANASDQKSLQTFGFG